MECQNSLKRVSFDGRMLGFEGDHYPKHCPLCVSTNSLNLIQYPSQCQCDGSHPHEHQSSTSHTCEDAYPLKLAKTIVEALFPSYAFRSVPHMTNVHSMATFATEGLEFGHKIPRMLKQFRKKLRVLGLRANNTWDDNTWDDSSAIRLNNLRSD